MFAYPAVLIRESNLFELAPAETNEAVVTMFEERTVCA